VSGDSRTGASFLPLVVLLVFVAGYIVTAHLVVDDESRRVPLLAAYITLVLLFAEIGKNALQRVSGQPLGESSGDVAGTDGRTPLRLEFIVLLCVAGFVGAIYVLGFAIAIPLYLIATVGLLGRQSIRMTLLLVMVTPLAVFLVFDVFLGTPLFKGALFS
jgi:hypothetical protein